MRRSDLNGKRIYTSSITEIWLVINGERRRIVSPAVYEALFSETTNLFECNELETIPAGPDLNEGTCLAKADNSIDRFLITGPPGHVFRHHIGSWEVWCAFAFNDNALHQVPSIIIDEIERGPPLVV